LTGKILIESCDEKKSGENIEKIVIGVPNNMTLENPENSQNSEKSQHIQKILAEISEIKKSTKKLEISGRTIEVLTFDEQFTSKIAEQSLYTLGYSAKKQKGKKDNMAAAIILQGYLDRSANLR